MPPHGGKLVYRVDNNKNIEGMQKMEVSEEIAVDIENIAYGVFSPLEGFMCRNDFENVVYNMRLENDLPWTIPIILDVNESFREGDEILLYSKNGMKAEMKIEEIYSYDKKELANKVFKTNDMTHPGVKKISGMKDKLIGGKITLIENGNHQFENYYLKPAETRVLFKEKRWKEIVAFQTRNVPHLGHEYVQKTALTFVDGLFINPIIGKKKHGDFKNEVILRAYDALIKNYYRNDTTVLSILRTEMRYAGPREAIFHAIMRKNFGCTHFIVGRDHAGVGNYYAPYEAHEIFNEFPDLGIIPIFFHSFFYCKKCGGVVNEKICPHDEKHHINFSGTAIRKMLINGESPPEIMMRKEVADVVMSYENPFVD